MFQFTALRAVALAGAIAVSGAACAVQAEETDARFAADLETFVAASMAELDAVPGVAVAVVSRDRTVYAGGFGYADIEAGLRADADTAFYIASATKPVTALAVGLLDARGEIDLDASFADLTPGVAFADGIDAEAVRLRDFLTHTSGVGNNPIVWRSAFTGEHDAETLWRLLASSEPNAEAPHGNFQYTNAGYNILTLLIERRTGRDWRHLVTREIFAPAGMTRTTPFVSRAEIEGWTIARPYMAVASDRVERIALEKTDATMQSAGGLLMSASDAARWLELQLNDGRLDGVRILPAGLVAATHARLVETGDGRPPFTREHYGLGWHIGAYGEDELVHHFGSFAGFRSHLSFMPGRDLGVAVFVNEATVGDAYADLLATWVYDWFAGRTDLDEAYAARIGQLAAMRDGMRQRFAADRASRADRAWTLTLPPHAYAGVYENPDFGRIVVQAGADGALTVSAGALRSVAEPFTQPDTIRVELEPFRGAVIGFLVRDGAVAALGHGEARYARID